MKTIVHEASPEAISEPAVSGSEKAHSRAEEANMRRFCALSEAHRGIWSCAGIIGLVLADEMFERPDFPDHITASLNLVLDTLKTLEKAAGAAL